MLLALLIAAVAATLLAFPAGAETVTRNTIVRGDRTVITSRGEDGRTRTRAAPARTAEAPDTAPSYVT